MKTRTSVVLAVIAAGLAIFIYFFERHQASTDELRDRGDRILPGFDRDRVDRIVLGEGDDRVELSRVKTDEPDAALPIGAVGQWQLTHPRELDADPGAVDKLLSSIDWLERRRTVDLEKTGKSLAALGLAEPRRVVSLNLRGRDVTLKVGGDAPGKGIYLSLSGMENVYVVDQEFLEQISKEVGDLRDKRLGRISVPDVTAVRISGIFHAQRQSEDRWELRAPIEMRANIRGVEDVVRDLEQLRATRFIADDVTDEELSRYGLDRPAKEVTLRVEGSDDGSEGEEVDRTVTLRFGSACEGQANEVYATAYGSGTVACVSGEIIDELDVDPLTLRDMRPTALEVADVERIEVTRGGQQLTLVARDDAWRIVDGENDQVGADEESVGDLIAALHGAQALDVIEELSGTGLEGDDPRPDVAVRLVRPDDGGEELLSFVLEPTRLLLRRGDEDVALALPVSFDEALTADPLRFRDRTLLDEDVSSAEEIELSLSAPLPSSTQVLRRGETRWGLTSPFEFHADDVVVRDIVRALSSLRAERFVAATPTAEHGLSRPRIRLRIQFEGGRGGPSDGGMDADGGAEALDGGAAGGTREYVLMIGNEVDEEGWYAMLDGTDRTVFVVPTVFVERLDRPLVDRDLFALDEEQVRSLAIERAGQERVDLERSDRGWQVGEEAAPSGAVEAILSRFEVARASEVIAFGPASAETGLRAPRARLFFGISEEEEGRTEERIIAIGNEYGEDDLRRVYVRLEGVDATFGVPERTIRPVLEYGFENGGDSQGGDAGDPSLAEAGVSL